MKHTAYQLYMREIDKMPSLTIKAETEYFKAWKAGSAKARTVLYSSNLLFVVKIAHKYKHLGIDILDLINEGNLALDRALNRFDHEKNLKFISYAVWWVRQAILQHLAEQGQFVSVTGAEMTLNVRMMKMGHKLAHELGREATDEELSNATGLTLKKINHMRRMLVPQANPSLQAKIDSDSGENLSIQDVIADRTSPKPDDVKNREKRIMELFHEAKLSEQQINVVTSFFGINTGKRNLEEISFDYGKTKERMRQVKEEALERLKGFDQRHQNELFDILSSFNQK